MPAARPSFAGCSGKWKYPNATLAWRIVQRMNRNREPGEYPLNAYRCSGCGHYHVGHKDKL